MGLRHIGLLVFITGLIFCGCNRKSFGMIDSTEYIHVNRFDSALFQWIETDNSYVLEQIKNEYPQMFDILGKSLFQANNTDTSTLYANLINYYSEPTLKGLYKDAIDHYTNDNSSVIATIEKELSYGFKQIKQHFPEIQIPAIYMHVSGLQQNTIVADSLLSCSIDKYLGADYPLYENFFYNYQRKSMIPERIAKDCIKAWLKSEYPYHGKDNILLDRMIYEGKIIYLLSKIGYNYTYQDIMSLTKSEYDWCVEYESALWTTIIERKYLYTPDVATTSKFFQPIPSTFISKDAPGDLGYFIGYRIVEKYMKRTKSGYEELMKNNDAQDILKKSKYKP